MCYNVTVLVRKKLANAKQSGADPFFIAELESQLADLQKKNSPNYKASGFDHPTLPVVINQNEPRLHMLRWGLIPHWCTNQQQAYTLSNSTLNARCETILDKPAFRQPVRTNRCLVLVDGFFEHHHLSGRAYAFHMALKEDSAMILAGIWDDCSLDGGPTLRTVSIVTTQANPLMGRIHNGQKNGPRMPVILSPELAFKWIAPVAEQELPDLLAQISIPFPETELNYWPARPLTGQGPIPAGEKILERMEYPELAFSDLL